MKSVPLLSSISCEAEAPISSCACPIYGELYDQFAPKHSSTHIFGLSPNSTMKLESAGGWAVFGASMRGKRGVMFC